MNKDSKRRKKDWERK